MAVKITMKVDKVAHQRLQIVKGMMGAITFSEALQVLCEEYIEKRTTPDRKKV